MRKLALTAAIALASSLAFAGGQGATGTSGSEGAASTGKPTDKGAGDTLMAQEHWSKHAEGGYMTKENAMQFKGADGKTVDMQKLDMDSDGKVSEREWAAYHESAGAAGVPETKSSNQ